MIASQLTNRKEGLVFTRNAIVGKARRMKLGFHPTYVPGKPNTATASVVVDPDLPTPARTRAPPIEPKLRPLIEVDETALIGKEPVDGYCKWPFGEPGTPDFSYCGIKCRNKRTSFCDEKHAEHKQPAPPKTVDVTKPHYYKRFPQRWS